MSTDCSNHKKDLYGHSDMKEVAEAIGDLRYDTLAELFGHLQEKLFNDMVKDNEGGRPKLGHCLLWTHYAIRKAWTGAERAWEISKPFMNQTKEDKDNG